MTFPPHVAWMGGSRPGDWLSISDDERAYTIHLYCDQADIWLRFWKTQILPQEQHEIFWNRARGDAHATFREAARHISALARAEEDKS